MKCNLCGKWLYRYALVGVEDGKIYCAVCSKSKGIDSKKSLGETICSNCDVLVVELMEENIDTINSRVFCSEKCRTDFSKKVTKCDCGKEI